MVNHENRLLSEPSELLTAAGVAMDDLYVRKEPGTVAYDTTGLSTVVSATGTLSQSSTWAAHMMTFQGSGTPAHVKSLTSGTDDATGADTTLSIALTVPAGGVPIGDLVVVVLSYNDDELTGVETVTDTGGNSYTHEEAVGSNFHVFWSILTTALVASDTITVGVTGISASDQDVNAVAVADQFTGVTSLLSEASATGTGTAVAVGPTAAVSAFPVLSIFSAYTDQTSTTLAAGSDFTKRTEVFNNNATLAVDDRGARIASRVDLESPTIIGLFDWYSDVETTPAGTVTTVSGSTTVTGSGTTFTNHAPGDRIVVGNETRIISSIASATSLTTTQAFLTASAGAAYKIRVGNRIITATTNGNIFKEKPLTLTTGNLDAVTLVSGLNRAARPGKFVAGGKEAAAVNRKLFYFNGVDPVQVLSGDGTTMAAITTPPADWSATANEGQQPISGLIHENRLIAWGNLNDPHRAYASDPDDHEDFTSAATLSLRFRSDIGDRIWCAASFQGIFFVWKYPRGIFYLDDTDTDTSNWVVRAKSEAIGCAPSPYAALPIDDDVLFIAADGTFHLLTAVDALGGTRASDITRKLGLNKWIRENVDLTRLNQILSVWYPQKKLAVFTVPSLGSEVNDLTLKFDFSGVERGLPLKFSYSTRDVADGLAIRRAPQGGPETPIIGQAAFVFLMDQEDRNANGVAYTGQYQTPHLDFSHIDPGLRDKRKLYEHLELLMEPVAAGTLTVEVYVDGTLRQTLSYDATRQRQSKRLNVGDGFTISLRVTNSTLDEDFKVLSHLVYYKAGNEDQNR
jgi:hypothetical protein